jgi:SAM-dependent methyltransferase
MVENALTRFSDRVEDYLKYRPGYPAELITILREHCELTSSSVVADIGSGTGNLARLFLENGNVVFAVEPNPEMRGAGLQLLCDFDGYHSVDGSAEETHLPGCCADFVTAAQAFHWFDWPHAKAEFQRILRPSGWIVLVWNDRRFDSAFARDYERMKERGKFAVQGISKFFSGDFQTARLDNFQLFDFAGLRGRLLSASYAPKPNHPNHMPMLNALEDIFYKHASNGTVKLQYYTNMYFGHLR